MTDFHLLIADWYRQMKRDLPWRATNDPYFIWLSEVILQQTRVDQGTSYYYRFIETFPTVNQLAQAELQTVLNLWQGLGYYSRARNLHQTAKIISNEHQGIFPNSYAALILLKGIGPYTAAAVASFAFNENVPVVDGNVYRVLSRYFDIDTPINSSAGIKLFKCLAEEVINPNDPALHNQAIMEFGALHCTPKNPKCDTCVLQASCLSFANATIQIRPVKTKKLEVRNRFFHYLIFNQNGDTYIQQRKGRDIWEELYQFPMLETEGDEVPPEIKRMYGDSLLEISAPVKHLLSHQRISARFYHINVTNIHPSDDWILIHSSAIQDYPIPRLLDKYLETHSI
jgi:A/G-specific adenine glycosylase